MEVIKNEITDDILLQIIDSVHPEEENVDKRPLPGIEPNPNIPFSRFASGVDCDEVQDNLLIGNG